MAPRCPGGRTAAADVAASSSGRGLVVLDKDGVILDFHALWGAVTEARVRLVREALGAHAPDGDELAAWLGVDAAGRPRADGRLVTLPGNTTLAQLTAWLSLRGIPDTLVSRVPGAFHEAFTCLPSSAYRPLPGVAEALAGLRDAGWQLVVATSDTRAHARMSLERAGLGDLLRDVVGGDEVTRPKPAPDLYLEACKRSGVAESCSVAIGDTPGDMRMARAGGAAKALAVTSGFCTAAELAPLADRVFGDLAGAAGHIASHGLS